MSKGLTKTGNRLLPTFRLELDAIAREGGPVAGVDEAGRGPLAGPVVAAAVIIDEHVARTGLEGELSRLNDSKLLKEGVREQLHDILVQEFSVGIGIADVERVDRDNILNATLWAMQRAVEALETRPCSVLVDGNRCPDFGCPARAIVKGDTQCLSISAASVIAKVTRDRIMRKLGVQFPEYGFEQHKGYGTRAHLEAINRHGVTQMHRRSFRPVQRAMGEAGR